MDKTTRRIYQLLIIAGVGMLLLVLALASPLLMSGHDFSIYNTGWNGCSDVAIRTYQLGVLEPTFSVEGQELQPVEQSFVEYDLVPSNSTIVLIGPTADFTRSELEYLQWFVTNGGMLLVADDFGTGNQILQGVNSSCRFSNDLLMDLSFEKQPSFVTVFDFTSRSHPVVRNVSQLLLNYPTSLSVHGNATVVARSTQMSWLDQNQNGKEDVDEPQGRFPVLAVENRGAGELVMFSGPSLLINSMQDQLGNQVFRDNLFSYVFDGRDTVIFDEAHRAAAVPWSLGWVFPEPLSIGLRVGILLLITVAFIVAFTPLPSRMWRWMLHVIRRRRHEEPPQDKGSLDAMVDEVMRRHPEWNRKRVKRLAVEMMHNEST